jgi:predicted phosphohydrolase
MAKTAFAAKPVLYVAGNHEYDGSSIPHLTAKLRDEAAGSNTTFLENDVVVIGDTRCVGCTLWTDFALLGLDDHRDAMLRAEDGLTDYRRIRRSPTYCKLRAFDTMAFHKESLDWLEQQLETKHDGPTVVITHHAPSRECVLEKFDGHPLSPAYASSLEHLIDGRATVWVHGHTHRHLDFTRNGTRVVSNQRGYPDEPGEGFDPGFVIDV